MPTATYFGGSCVLDESVLHAGTMLGPAGATSACSLALVHLGGHMFFSFWSFYSHIRPAERQMVTLLINNFLYWIGAFSKRESDSEGQRYPSACEPGVYSGVYQIPAMHYKPTAEI